MPAALLTEETRAEKQQREADTWKKLRRRIEQKLRRKIRRRGYDPRAVDPDDIADAVSAGMVSVVKYWLTRDGGEWRQGNLKPDECPCTGGESAPSSPSSCRRCATKQFNYAAHHGFQRAVTYFDRERQHQTKELPHAVLPARGTPPRYRPAEQLMLPGLLDRLPPRQAEVVYLRCGLRETLAATARKVGAHVSTVRRDEAAALEKLRGWYEDEKEI